MTQFRRINRISWLGPGLSPVKDPFTCNHDWKQPNFRGADGYCEKCEHTFNWSEDTRGRSLEWWIDRREALDAKRAKPGKIDIKIQ